MHCLAQVRAGESLTHGPTPRMTVVELIFQGFRGQYRNRPEASEGIYQRTSTAPQVKPPPIASISTMSPALIRPSLAATSRASGMDAAEVLPWESRVITTRSIGIQKFRAAPSRTP